MTILFYYNNLFGDGGIPREFRKVISALNRGSNQVIALTVKKEPCKSPFEKNVFTARNGLASCLLLFKLLRRKHVDIVVLAEYFYLYCPFLALITRLSGTKLILYPTNQINRIVFQNDLFTVNPSVRFLERNSATHSMRKTFASYLKISLKNFYKHSLGRLTVRLSNGIAVLSEHEKQKIQETYPSLQRFIHLPWCYHEFTAPSKVMNFYAQWLANKKVPVVVYWGRMDFWMKGIDRLIEGVRWIQTQSNHVPFKLFLIGPDYKNGSEQIKQLIVKYGLGDSIYLLLPGMYPAGDLSPLREANVSVILSRWDGMPRAVRESLLLDVPVVVSPETHFSDHIKKFEAGVVVSTPDNAECVGRALLDAVNHCAHYTSNCSRIPLQPEDIATSFWNQLKEQMYDSAK